MAVDRSERTESVDPADLADLVRLAVRVVVASDRMSVAEAEE